MKRRQVVSAAVGLIGMPSIAGAQVPRPPGKIGYLHPSSIAPDQAVLRILRSVWQPLGYVEGESVLLRSAEGDSRRFAQLVTELTELKVGVLIVVGAEAVGAASRTTRTTPIVAIDLETDPVRAGLASSFARPGGNVTGLFLDLPSLAGKWIELMREAVPSIVRLALMWDPTTSRYQLETAQSVARAHGVETLVIEMHPAVNFDDALRGLAGQSGNGIVCLTSAGLSVLAPRIAAAAQKYRLPTVSHFKNHARSGLLMTYGPVQEAYFARAVVLADKILRGEKPGELPIEAPLRYELVINMNTAKTLGLKLPIDPAACRRGDRVKRRARRWLRLRLLGADQPTPDTSGSISAHSSVPATSSSTLASRTPAPGSLGCSTHRPSAPLRYRSQRRRCTSTSSTSVSLGEAR